MGESNCDLIETLSRHASEGTEENCDKLSLDRRCPADNGALDYSG
jgi:hypothetical protein